MAMISDIDYILQAVRLSSLRITDDPLTPRIISLDPGFSLNPYITAAGLADIDRWPEIRRALESPPLEESYLVMGQEGDRKGGLSYTQTIMGPGRTGGAGMRVSGRHVARGESRQNQIIRSNSTTPVASVPSSPRSTAKAKESAVLAEEAKLHTEIDVNYSSAQKPRPRADSAPMPGPSNASLQNVSSSMLSTGRGVGVEAAGRLLHKTLSSNQMSIGSGSGRLGLGVAALETPEERDSSVGMTVTVGTQTMQARMVGGLEDQGSDVDEEEAAEAEVKEENHEATAVSDSRRVSIETNGTMEKLDFRPIPVSMPAENSVQTSALTTALNKYIPHLVSTAPNDLNAGPVSPVAITPINPFYSLYSSTAAPPGASFVSLELYFPHSENPTQPIVGKVRKDATVEEVLGYGLWRYWDERREPKLEDEENEIKWSTVGWGLRIVEDDGEVDEDFPALDRESKISKFIYESFAIVKATEDQIRQNAAKAPSIIRRPSRVLALPLNTRPSIAAGVSRSGLVPPQQATAASSLASSEFSPSSTAAPSTLAQARSGASTAMKGSSGLSSTGSDIARLKVRVTVSADVHFTTTINVPSDMYIADLTEVLCKKKRLQMPATDWVLCLADLTLALPLDRTVASLEGRIELALVKRTWAVEHGLRIDDRRGGDPSASIFKRQSEPAPFQRFGHGITDFSQTYKKFTVQRKIAIGRHERVLAIDGDYIHIMPSESRAFFDSMKTTSFHISLVAQCKLTGRAGGFKINVWRDGAQKRYEFEAENQKQAVEIVSTIRQL
nr:hypothetical protein L204_04896 [Cryptococcus depauperatus CBS 7855]